MQAGRAQPLIKLNGFRAGLDVVTVMSVERFPDEFVNLGRGAKRVGGQGLVAEQQQAVAWSPNTASRKACSAQPTIPALDASPSSRE